MDSKKRGIVIALMVATFLGAVEGTVVTTAIPTIVKDLQGFEIISSVFSIYLLTSAISTPIYGKLSDLYGRKNVICIGIIIFLVGSTLCGISQNMYMLIASRAVQGLGAGAIFTVTYTIIGDLFTIEQRPKIQGIISSVWGIASIAGPFLGGIIIDMLSWHWIFFVNLPFGILSVILIQKNLKENFEKKEHKIDFVGTITLSAAMLLFLSIFSSNKGIMFNIISMLITLILIGIFLKVEKKAKEPIIPLEIFTKSSTIVNLVSLLASAILICIDVYLIIYIQNVLGFNPSISGLSLAPISCSWILSSVILGKLITKYGEKIVIIISNLILLISSILLSTLGVNSSLMVVIIYGFIMGFGFGGAFTTLTIIVQESVEHNKRGVAVATNSLLRTLGQTIGISIFGSIFNLYIVKYFENIGINNVNPNDLYNSNTYNILFNAEQIKSSLNSAMHILFLILIVISIVSLILSIIMPKFEKNNVIK